MKNAVDTRVPRALVAAYSQENPEDPLESRDATREAVYAIQEIARVTWTKGRISKSVELVLRQIKEETEKILVADNDNSIVCLCPDSREATLEALHQTIKVHLIGFFRANENDLSGTIFDTSETGKEEARKRYISELTTIFLENGIWFPGKTKSEQKALQKLSQYYGTEYVQAFFEGTSIKSTLQKAGIEMSDTEIEKDFPRSIRLHFAVNNISDPLKALKRVGQHLTETLTNKNIKETIKKSGIEISEVEIKESFTRGRRLYFAVNNISDPLAAVGRVGQHLTETLTNKNIKETLQKAGIEMSNTGRFFFSKSG